MEKETSLIFLSRAEEMLVKASTIQEIKEFKDIALTAKDWAERKGLGENVVREANSLVLQAERKLGKMLKETERAKGTKGQLKGKDVSGGHSMIPPEDDTPTLAELGITKRESSEAQLLADIEEEEFEKLKEGKTTKKAVLNEKRREKKRDELKEKSLIPGDKKYRIIYADPPWEYSQWLPHQYGDVGKHYPPMSISKICSMPIKEMIADNSVLFLWTTSPKLEQAFEVIGSWGYEYKTSFIWDKVKHNFGHYNSVRHEILLVAGKGSSTPDNKKLFDSVISIERSEKHSEKPSFFRDMIDELYNWGDRIELFFRGKEIKDGWDIWGNED